MLKLSYGINWISIFPNPWQRIDHAMQFSNRIDQDISRGSFYLELQCMVNSLTQFIYFGFKKSQWEPSVRTTTVSCRRRERWKQTVLEYMGDAASVLMKPSNCNEPQLISLSIKGNDDEGAFVIWNKNPNFLFCLLEKNKKTPPPGPAAAFESGSLQFHRLCISRRVFVLPGTP